VTGRTPTGAAPGTSRKRRHADLAPSVQSCRPARAFRFGSPQTRASSSHALRGTETTAPCGQIDRMIIKSVFAALLGVTLTWTWKRVVGKVHEPAYPRHPLTKATQPALSTSLSTFPRVSAFPVTSLTTHSHTLHAHVLLESCGWFTTAWYVIVVCSTTTVASGGHSKLHQ
jgi:hypothetical protein